MNAVKEPTELDAALDKRERVIDAAVDVVLEAWQASIKAALDDSYEEGFEAGELQGRHDLSEEYEENSPIAMLIATVKEFQVRRPSFHPQAGFLNRYFYDNLISFLESGELPPEWQP